MSRRYRQQLLHALVILIVSVPATGWGQTVGTPAAFPTTVPVAVGTPVRVTAGITGSVIAASVVLQRIDAAGRVVGTLGALVDDGTQGDLVAGDKTFTARPTVYEPAAGAVRLRVAAAFQGRLALVLSAPVTVLVSGASATVTIAQPANLAFLNVSPAQVRGTVGDAQATVVINGVAAAVATDRTFTAQVPLLEGTNTLTAVATNSNQAVTTASVQVTLDTTPPRVHIDTPAAAAVTSAATLNVGGLVNDIVVGTVNAQQATVTVNGLPAQVANRSFLAANVPLALGPNTLQAVATDRSGNSATTTVQVTRVPVTGGTIRLVGGNNQTAAAGSVLPQPLVVQVTDALNQPAVNQPVVFRVVENSGGLVSGTARLGTLAVQTDGTGQAAATLQLGARSGVGNNVVEAEATGFAGTAVFAASGTPTAATQIVVDTGNGQTGVVGQALPLPFIAIVTDAGYNRLPHVPVTFTVRQGGGLLGGKPTLTTLSDSDGRVAAVLTVGYQEGFDNNVVEATFAGLSGQPAAFLASARVPGDAALTSITGVVVDNQNQPIPGVRMRLFQTHHGTGLPTEVVPSVTTAAGGTFRIQPAPVGAFKLMADGAVAPNGPWPTLEFDLVTVAGRVNDVGLPIYLPRLDPTSAACVNETTGGEVRLPQVPGFKLVIAPGAATFPGGARSGCVTVTPVNADKVPMAPGFGQQPRFVVTIQPVGTLFNPPAQLTLPNVDGLAPRAVTEMYSYDHDLAAFVAIGTGTVSEDGAVIVSDPGVGVIKAGWHCGGNPNPVGSAGECGDCATCVGTQCQPDAAKEGKCVNNQICVAGRGTPLAGAACPANTAIVPTVNNLGDWAGCTEFGLADVVQPPAQPTVSGCLSADCVWGFRVVPYSSDIHAGVCSTNIDITGANDADVTEATYCDVIQDLTPDATGRPTRATYWASAITRRHENFHVTEWETALRARWPAYENAVEALTVPASSAVNSAAAALAARQATINNAFTAAFNAAMADWHATGEDPAYADGRVSYQDLVDGVCTRARTAGWVKTTPCGVCQP